MYTVDTNVSYKAEADAQEALYVTIRVLEVDEKRVRFSHNLHRRRDDTLLASGEQLYLHVSTPPGRTSPMDPGVRARLAQLRDAPGSGRAQDRRSRAAAR